MHSLVWHFCHTSHNIFALFQISYKNKSTSIDIRNLHMKLYKNVYTIVFLFCVVAKWCALPYEYSANKKNYFCFIIVKYRYVSNVSHVK